MPALARATFKTGLCQLALATALLAWLATPAPARADPSAQFDLCRGAVPTDGALLRGPVLHVLDGQTLCVARGADPTLWTRVQLTDAPPSASRATLMAAAFGKDVICSLRSGRATCQVEGRGLGDVIAEPATVAAGRAWREARAGDLQAAR